MTSFLSEHGITQCSSCPYTPEQNGCTERKHRHIVETGLSLLHHSFVPYIYWPSAFETAFYVINCLPTPLLENKSPFTKLFNQSSDYTALRIFGCLCYPWLRYKSQSKFALR